MPRAVNAKKTSRAQQRVAIRDLPPASGLVPGGATRGGRSPFFGLTASSEDPANSYLERRTPPTPRWNVAVSLAFISLRTTLRFCPSRSVSVMA